MLHLVDDEGQPVGADIRVAVEAAYQASVLRFSRIDQAILAGFAEGVAASMNRRRSEIQALRSYAQVAMNGRVQEWFRHHPGVEIGVDDSAELERIAGGVIDRSFDDAELEVLFSQMKTHLGERDLHIFVLMEQDLGNPGDVAAAFHISYNAAAKAIQRAKEHMAALLGGIGKNTPHNHDSSRNPRRFNLR